MQSPPLSPAIPVPTDVPEITSVGGIDFRATPSGGGLATASWGADAWAGIDENYLQTAVDQPGTSGNRLAGGGYSSYFAAPSWQANLLPGGATGRGVPDTALPASPTYPGIAMEFGGSQTESGGTSMAAPMFARYLADMAAQSGSNFGDVNPALYQAVFNNPGLVTRALYGYDGYWAVDGGSWNPLTGLGTPDMDALYQALTGDAPQDAVAELSPSVTAPLTVSPGTPVSITFTAVNSAGAPVQGATVSFAVTGSLQATNLSSTEASTDSNGQVTVTYTDNTSGDTGTVTATSLAGGNSQTATITIAQPQPAAMAFTSTNVSEVAGRPVSLGLSITAGDGSQINAPVPVTVVISGPRDRVIAATAQNGSLSPLRLVKAGIYALMVSANGVSTSTVLTVVPASPAAWRYRTPRYYYRGKTWREGLAAYDQFGNLDTLIQGTVTWTWRLGGKTYHAVSRFVDGVAWGSFVVPAKATGELYTSTHPSWVQG